MPKNTLEYTVDDLAQLSEADLLALNAELGAKIDEIRARRRLINEALTLKAVRTKLDASLSESERRLAAQILLSGK